MVRSRSSCVALLMSAGAIGIDHWSCTRPAAAREVDAAAAVEVAAGGRLLVPAGSPLRQKLEVRAAVAQAWRRELSVPAQAEADPALVAKISPPLAGRIVRLYARLGDAVAQGTPLFALDSPDLVAAQSDFLKARSSALQAERNLRRQEDLEAHGIGARKEREQAQTDLDVARSEQHRAATRLKLLSMEPDQIGRPLVVRAPLAGRVIDLATAAGQFQNDPAAVLLTIADLAELWVTASVPEKDIARVALGDEALVDFAAYPGERFAGRVQLIGDVLATETRTVKVRIRLPNPRGRLKPGMFARVSLRGPEAPQLVVPAPAVLLRGSDSFVFVERAPWEFERRKVELGEPAAGGLTVLAGLSAGERLITANTVLLP